MNKKYTAINIERYSIPSGAYVQVQRGVVMVVRAGFFIERGAILYLSGLLSVRKK